MRRLPLRLIVDRLESRLTPAMNLMGPFGPADLRLAAETAGSAWTSPTGMPQLGVLDHQPEQFLPLSLNVEGITSWLTDLQSESVIALPKPDGSLSRFKIWEIETMEPGLAFKFPDIHTYRGQGMDDPGNMLAVTIGPTGFHSRTIGPAGDWSIEPADNGYMAFNGGDLKLPPGSYDFEGDSEKGDDSDIQLMAGPVKSSGATLRTFRAAIAATGEYYALSGSVVANVQANMVTVLNVVNLAYERDFAVRMVLVANNDSITFTNSGTDPYTDGNLSKMLNENQTTIDTKIGSANYDIGHVFGGNGGGGLAQLSAVGQAGQKARAGTIAQNFPGPDGGPAGNFMQNTVMHEMGHSFGAGHTFNGVNGGTVGQRDATSAVEPGSGSSLMAYPGIADADDLQLIPDRFFHSASYDQVMAYLATIPAVGTSTATGNGIPTVNAGLDATIPANTPFALTATASDPNGDILTYSWEQRDLGAAQALGSADNGASPLFRVFAPVSGFTRQFPNLTTMNSNFAPIGETLPTTNRSLNFTVMVRDNKAGGGAVNTDAVKLTVTTTGGPFRVTAPNAVTSWNGNSFQPITWDVAGTNAGAINTPTVNIRLSTDGGLTYPTVLAAATANDGIEFVQIPNTATTNARIKVEAVGNYFFDISDSKFSIVAGTAMQVATTSPAFGSIAASPLTSLDVNFTNPVLITSVGTDDITLSAGTVSAANLTGLNKVTYTLSGVPLDGNVTVTMKANAVQDVGAVNVGAFSTVLTVDSATRAFPTPLAAVNPVGSLSYTGSTTGSVATTSDTDAVTIDLTAGQSIAFTAVPSSGLRPSLTLTGPGGVNVTNTAAAAGNAASVASAITVAGTYTVTISGASSTTGNYTLNADLNSLAEVESNDTTGTSQAIGLTAYDLGGGATRYSARSRLLPSSANLTAEVEPNNTASAANDARRNFVSVSGNQFQLSIAGTQFGDVFNLGPMQFGDKLTVGNSGSAGWRGTAANPDAILVNSAFTGVSDGDNGPGADGLISQFSIPSAENWYLITNTEFGTYQFGVLLTNTGAAPATFGSFFNEVEPNDSIAGANDASTSWRAVNFSSTTTGSIADGDTDFLRYQFTAGDLITPTVTAAGGLDAFVRLRNSAGVIIAADDGNSTPGGKSTADAAIQAVRIPTTGVYTLEVGSNGGSGTYSVAVALSSATTPPAKDTTPDLYSVSLTAGQTFSAGLKALTAGNVDLALLDAGGIVIASGVAGSTNYDENIVDLAIPSTGTYHVRVTGDFGVEYQFAATTNAALDREANDSFGTAQNLTNSRALGAVVGGNEDWYSFNATAGQSVTVTTATPSGGSAYTNSFDPIVEIYSPANVKLGADDNSLDGKNSKLTVAAASTGLYRVRVLNAGGTSGEYIITQTATVGAPPPRVSGPVIINNGDAQRSRVNSVIINFDSIVTLPGSPETAFTLQRQGDSKFVALTATPANDTATHATLTFNGALSDNGSLADGRYTLTILNGSVSNANGNLDGNGDGTGGDDFVLASVPAPTLPPTNIFRLFGDSNADGKVDSSDFIAFRNAFNAIGPNPPYNNAFDFNIDNTIDSSDFIAFRNRFNTTV